MKRIYLLALLGLFPTLSHAYSLPKANTAQLLPPQHLSTEAGVALGDDHWALGATGRLGVTEDIDIALRAGLIYADGGGFEAGLGGRYRLMPATTIGGQLEYAAALDLNFAYAGPAFTTGIDPKVLVSYHYTFAEERQVFFGAGAGVAVTAIDKNGQGDDTRAGFIASTIAGMDVSKRMRVSSEFAWRDSLLRFGATVGYRF